MGQQFSMEKVGEAFQQASLRSVLVNWPVLDISCEGNHTLSGLLHLV